MVFIKSILSLLFFIFFTAAHAQVSTIAVAANMKDAFLAIEKEFKVDHKGDFRVIYGSSGNISAQILNGAPFSLFISADESYPLELFKRKMTRDEGKVYAIGKIALLSKKSKGIAIGSSKAELTKAIKQANKIAIAKPELAPYGKAAVDYLKAEGLWDLAKDKLVYGDNISMATMYVASGSADIGFTALSLALAPGVAKETEYLVLNPALYEPIQQRMVLMKNAPQEAVALYQFMQSPKAQAILRTFGYQIP
ncbi:molybdate ABC transporter substrate-binding protein [Polynucleobacter difficilis]|uniref:molybdate ABC transporter substrate-binding protein n=1 Tax=Polynucleobacter difficilis TaxID=556054 RepID=UPI000D35520F|nr:molybdate ABC transporter substrate-binding protein [Polynucleobacter difficilis]